MTELSALELIEDAVALLRSAPTSAWNIYALGAAPFMLALVYSVAALTMHPATSAQIATGSLLMAVLFGWLSWCKSRFAGRLFAQLALSGAPPESAWRTFSVQALAQGAKLIVLPLSLAAILPFGYMVAFFRSASVPAAGDPFRRAARMARLWQHQNWLALALILLFGLAVFANIAVLLFVLPFLVQTFSGYQNEFTHHPNGMINWTFFTAAVGLTWLCIDPALEAIYVVRCFKGESVASGADLRAMLRRLSCIAAILLSVAGGMRARDLSPAELDGKIRQTIQKPEYSWRTPTADLPADDKPGWMDDTVKLMRRGLRAIGHAIEWFFDQIRRLFENPSAISESRGKAPPRTTLRWVMYGLIALIAAILFVIMRQVFVRRSGSAKAVAAALAKPVNLAQDHILASELPEDEWLAMAREALARGDYRLALRAVYLANLAWLGRVGLVTVSRFKSNREYERELRIRGRSDDLTALFARNRAVFESAWYGIAETGPVEVDFMERNLSAMRALSNA